jgi:hypothetical protein
MPFGKGHLPGAVHGDKQVRLAFLRLDLGPSNVPVAKWVVLAVLLRPTLSVFAQRQAAAVALETAGQGRAGEGRDSGLQGTEAVVQRQERVWAKGHRKGFWAFLTVVDSAP